MSRSDSFKVGDEGIVANYARKPVTKCDVSKPKKTDDKPTVPEAGKSEEETDSSNINSGNGEVSAPEFEDGGDGDGSEPEFEDGSDGGGNESDAPVVQPQAVGRGRHDVAEPVIPVVWPEALGGGRCDVDGSEPAASVVQPHAVGGGRHDVAEPKPDIPNETEPEVVGASEPATPVVQPQAVGRGRHDVAEPKPDVPNETAPEVVGGMNPPHQLYSHRLLAEVGMT